MLIVEGKPLPGIGAGVGIGDGNPDGGIDILVHFHVIHRRGDANTNTVSCSLESYDRAIIDPSGSDATGWRLPGSEPGPIGSQHVAVAGTGGQ